MQTSRWWSVDSTRSHFRRVLPLRRSWVRISGPDPISRGRASPRGLLRAYRSKPSRRARVRSSHFMAFIWFRDGAVGSAYLVRQMHSVPPGKCSASGRDFLWKFPAAIELTHYPKTVLTVLKLQFLALRSSQLCDLQVPPLSRKGSDLARHW